jgi:hypothetical protein
MRPGRVALAAAALYVPVVLAAASAGAGSVREFLSYVWQFYLPRLSSMTPTIGPDDYDVREAFTDRLYGTLAQLEVVLPHGLATFVYWFLIAGLAALVAVLVRRRAQLRRRADVAVVLGIAIPALLLGLHLAAYRAMLGNPADPIITARYLLPLVSLFAVAVGLVLRELPRRVAPAAAGLLLAGAVAMQLVSIGLLVERFYA